MRRRTARRHLRERAVVACGDERVVHGGVEAPAGSLAGGEGERDHFEQLRPDDHPSALVQPRELGVGIEAREQALEPEQVGLGSRERAERLAAGLRIENQLDPGAHRVEAPPQHQELRVVATGGSVTTRTGGAAPAAALCRDCARAAR